MSRNRRVVTALAVLGLCLPLPACSGGAGGTESTVGSGQAFVAGDGSIVTVDPADRQPAPDLVGTTLSGDRFSLADQRGHVVVLNVWASWCAPCRSEAPALAQVARDTAKRGVVFVGLVTRDSEAAARAFVERFDVPYPSVVDADGALQLQFGDSLPPQAIPSTLVIDAEGRVAARVLGEVSAANLRALVDEVKARP